MLHRPSSLNPEEYNYQLDNIHPSAEYIEYFVHKSFPIKVGHAGFL